jgi:probable HAF family extracellular repeat protein
MIIALPLASQTRYVVTDLGSLGGTNPYGGSPSSAFAINNLGQVAGTSYLPNGQNRGFRTGPNMPINPATDAIGTLGGTNSTAAAINNVGQVSGSSQLANGHTHAIRVDAGGTITDLGVLGGTIDFSLANGINDSGQVTGASWHATPSGCFVFGGSVAFRTSSNGAVSGGQDLGTLLSNCRGSDGYAIDAAGNVVGYSAYGNLGDPVQHAMLAPAGGGLVDLGVLGGTPRFPAVSGTNAVAYGINSSGQIVGTSTYSHDSSIPYYAQHAFLTTASGPMQDLGTLGGSFSSASGINVSGQIVGNATTAGDAALHAFLYSGGIMTDLNSMLGSGSGWTVDNAVKINDNGQIIANAKASDGSPHAVRLDPANIAAGALASMVANPSLGLTSGQVSSLSTKLTDIAGSIQSGQNNAAVNQLNAFVNQVQAAVRSGKMEAATGNMLIAAANAMIAALS